jgi:hypothetical protein
LNVNGKEVEQTYTVLVPVTTQEPIKATNADRFVPDDQSRTHPAKLIQAFDLNGNKLDPEAWMKQLEKPKHVLLLRAPMTAENRIDPFFSAILKEDTILLYLEKSPTEEEGKVPNESPSPAPTPKVPATEKPQ